VKLVPVHPVVPVKPVTVDLATISLFRFYHKFEEKAQLFVKIVKI
jgi:hypothetical protein